MQYTAHACQRMAERGIDSGQVDLAVACGRRSSSRLIERVDFRWLDARQRSSRPRRIDRALEADGLTVVLASEPIETVITVSRRQCRYAFPPVRKNRSHSTLRLLERSGSRRALRRNESARTTK